jgi:hypothetical protein
MTNLSVNSTSEQICAIAQKSRESQVEVCRNIPQSDIEECLLGSDRAKIKPWMQQHGRSQLAKTRTGEMEQIVKHQWSTQLKSMTTFLVAAVSAGIFGAASQLFTFRLPSAITIPISAGAGAGIGFVAEDRAKRCITHHRLKHGTRNILNQLEKNLQAGTTNEFDYEYYNAQILLLQDIEGKKYLKKQSLADPIAASALLLLEASAAFYLALPVGLLFFAFLAGALPLAAVLAAAAALSEYIDLPKEATKLIPEYEPHLLPWDNLTEPEILQMYRTVALIKYTLESTPGSRIKNREMCEAEAEMGYFEDKLQRLQQEMVQLLYQCEEEYEAAKKKVELTHPMPQVKRQGLGAEEYQALLEKAMQERQRLIEQEKARLDAEKQATMKKIADTYGLQIYQTQQQWDAAKERYEAAYEQWRARQELPRLS